MEWHYQTENKFDSLTEVGVTSVTSGSIGDETKFDIKYENGKIHFEDGAMAILGIGGFEKNACCFVMSFRISGSIFY